MNLSLEQKGSAGFAKRLQSARPLGQGVLDPTLLTIAMPQGHAKRPKRPQTGTAKPAAPPRESQKIVSKIISNFASVFDPQKTPKILPMGLPRGSQIHQNQITQGYSMKYRQ